MIELIIIDQYQVILEPRKKYQKVIFWQGYDYINDKNNISILNFIENNSDEIKKIYLKWIEELGNIQIYKGIPVYKYLKIKNKFSFWWQSFFIQKSNYEHSPHINDSIKLIALQKWMLNKKIFHIKLYTNNKKLAKCLSEFANNKKIKFENKVVSKDIFQIKKINFYKIIPYELKALIWITRKIIYSWPLRKIELNSFINIDSDVLFIDYFTNFNQDSLSKGIFKSIYWGNLTEKLKEHKIKTSWIHLLINLDSNRKQFKNSKYIRNKFKLFRKTSHNLETHTTLESFISPKIILDTIFDWLNLRNKSKDLFLSFKKIKIKDLNLSPLYFDEWEESCRGVSAISIILQFNLFDRAFDLYKNKSKVVYLFENQSWEFSMLQAWKRIKRNKIIGYSHTSIYYWDLRKFFSDNTFKNNEFPVPDMYALNGKNSYKLFLENNINKKRILKVEATRYEYLESNKVLKNNQKIKKSFKNKNLSILIICDYKDYYTNKQFQLLYEIKEFLNENFFIIIKPHPVNNKKITIDGLNFCITNKSVVELVNDIDIVFTSTGTATAVEFLHLGKLVITLIDDYVLNLSPLRNIKNVNFISKSNDLLQLLKDIKNNKVKSYDREDYFYLSHNFNKWFNLIIK